MGSFLPQNGLWWKVSAAWAGCFGVASPGKACEGCKTFFKWLLYWPVFLSLEWMWVWIFSFFPSLSFFFFFLAKRHLESSKRMFWFKTLSEKCTQKHGHRTKLSQVFGFNMLIVWLRLWESIVDTYFLPQHLFCALFDLSSEPLSTLPPL